MSIGLPRSRTKAGTVSRYHTLRDRILETLGAGSNIGWVTAGGLLYRVLIGLDHYCDVELCNEDLVQLSTRERIFHFSKETIAKLKEKANAEISTDKISSLQALLSHVWRSAIRNRSLDPNEETKFRIVVGARQRFRELPDNYFGNAIMGTFLTMKPKELIEQGIGNPAWRMNRTISAVTGESLKKFLESWPARPNFVYMSHVDALITIISPRFVMYGNDFGWGKPVAVRSGSSNKVDGMLTLFGRAEAGSIDVEVCLLAETLEAIANDDEFMDTVTS
ncbi:GPR107 protein [Hibiscus syriacus]|uniref:GPR107 protein n=1 Tax=Hibiscus syriacus TaxID=106335 RepID=A0A6A2ZYP3_HIBSY|nr:GPR107 protein [Hibiscus syriacus]